MDGLQFFDPNEEVTIVHKSLPHWAQSGAVCFITWRTADSLPAAAIERLAKERHQLLQGFGLNPNREWQNEFHKLPTRDRGRLQWSLFTAWDQQLDAAAGDCLLARPELSQIVEESLLHFDDDRYFLTDAVVMPNHVHLLAAFHDEASLLSQCSSWKRFTARRIQAALGQRGPFWQVEQFDHLVRSPEQFTHYRRYIAENPSRAKLKPGHFRHLTKRLT